MKSESGALVYNINFIHTYTHWNEFCKWFTKIRNYMNKCVRCQHLLCMFFFASTQMTRDYVLMNIHTNVRLKVFFHSTLKIIAEIYQQIIFSVIYSYRFTESPKNFLHCNLRTESGKRFHSLLFHVTLQMVQSKA